MDLPEVARRDVGAGGEENHAEDQVAEAAGRQPQHGDEDGEEERGEADVALEADDRHGGAPGDQERDERSRVEHQPVAEPRRRNGQHLLVGGEVRGEVDHEEDLGELNRLEGQTAGVHP